MKLLTRTGQHAVYHGDIEDDAHFQRIFHSGFTAIWTDPPWNPGIATIFRKNAEAEGKANLRTVLDRLCELIYGAPDATYIEFSASTPQYMKAALDRANIPWRVQDCVMQPGDKPAFLFRTGDTPPVPNAAILSWVDLAEGCLRALPADAIVLDPFVGNGTLVAAANRTGHQTITIDISEKRATQAANIAMKGLT